MSSLSERICTAAARLQTRLLAERNSAGHWRGELSSSALSTATAVMALAGADRVRHARLIGDGLAWLARTQDAAGAWGDTPESVPNLSTTALCWAAFGTAGEDKEQWSGNVAACEHWMTARIGSLEPAALAEALARRYGKDRTFSVPILMACALGGRLGASPGCWQHVPQLPFQLAALPRRWYAAMRLPVVSYALPALIAIGQVREHFLPGNPIGALMRRAARKRTSRLLHEIQPESGGYLEATPLTSFVTMALAGMGAHGHPVVPEAVAFLERSVRSDGSWPIDTDLATWGTTLSVKAMSGCEGGEAVRGWLLGQQYRTVHPYTISAPGGWAWTDLPGGVPDADDTSGALLALRLLGEPDDSPAAKAGVRWLLGIQNGNGGVPTFCRGWGALPFDRSTPEITAHALAAWQAWRNTEPGKVRAATRRALTWLAKVQHRDGWWEPLWFGNQHTPDEANPVYGTAMVLKYLAPLDAGEFPELDGLRQRAVSWLARVQQADGGWSGNAGGPPSVEETAVALDALSVQPEAAVRSLRLPEILAAGAEALLRLTDEGAGGTAAPVGLYFARLWYHEKLYPVIFALSAFSSCARRLEGTGQAETR